ncbi:CocE/NonD family hydrolase [Nocardia yamanashiensis]|uniref:CocE/NonD family hydrolase n=1 Tax=Nocardia yamanashiensis TaxID=209247 RepID=UPI001E45C862|nr:CocE/NonD family hydrolase [Nocardia yamanashiensis]UGT45069.1 CocE/NonD family hydrolase [Nocardia yamanashiensis]
MRMVLWRALVGLLLVVGAVVVPAGGANAEAGYQWKQEYITAPDGTRLHADVLRPKGLADDQRTPVIMTVSPYRAHLAYLTDPRVKGGPSTDNLEAQTFLDAGYTYVIVDLRGFGGSNGCPDFGGPGERSDVKTAVEWAAGQSWSTGKVGLFGVSYEAWTGLMGLTEQPAGLAAVGAFEPVVDPYSYLYMQGVAWKFSGKPVTESGVRPGDLAGLEHLLIASTPAHWEDSAEYQLNATTIDSACYAQYFANTTNHDGGTEFWQDRDLVRRLRGNTIPLFLGQGFTDYNTKADRVFQLWNGLGPGEHHAWFGQWGHRTCHDKCGVTNFDGELLAFFDRHVAGKNVTVPGPRITVSQSDGRWRSETQWPPADSTMVTAELRTGEYTDRGLFAGADRDLWSISQPLPTAQHLSGTATATLTLDGSPQATVAVEVSDIAPDGRSTVITRGIAPVSATTEIRMLAQDWPIEAGHRIGFRITDVIDDVWSHTPTFSKVTVRSAQVRLPLLTAARTPDLPGGPTEGVGKWRAEKSATLPLDLLNNARVTVDFPARTGS